MSFAKFGTYFLFNIYYVLLSGIIHVSEFNVRHAFSFDSILLFGLHIDTLKTEN